MTSLQGFTWFCLTKDTTDDQARVRFRQLYGRDPERITRDHHMVWCGPVPTHDSRPADAEPGDTSETYVIGQP